MSNLKIILIGFLAIVLSGCGAAKISLDYTPQNTLELEGNVAVKDFEYRQQSNPEGTLIPNTAVGGGLVLTEPVATFFTDAVRKELRQAGISLKEEKCYLRGEINKLLVDDLGFTVDYIAHVRYILNDKNGSELLDKTYRTSLDKMTKFVVAEIILNNLNKMLSDNIKALLSDQKFVMTLKENCS